MKKICVVACSLLLAWIPVSASIIDAPHNETNNITCGDCHSHSLWWQYSPVQSDSAVRIEKSNGICLNCHDGSNQEIISVLNHSSASLGSMHRTALGDFNNACVDCHDPHIQAQLNWFQTVPDSELFLVTGNLIAGSVVSTGSGTTAAPYSTTFTYENITVNQADWDNAVTPWNAKSGSSDRGLLLVLTTSDPGNTYEITSVNQGDSEITVNGRIDPDFDSSGASFGLIYGQLIRDRIQVDAVARDVHFFTNKGGFADLDTYDGICQVCHTKTRNFRNAGGVNFDDFVFDHTGKESENCMNCHSHSNGMGHAGGTGDAESCQECHGHDLGYNGFTGGTGSYETHSTHTESDADDARGPNIGCDGCHDTASMPDFNDGVTYSDYKSGAVTTVCDSCHSSQGSYDGVNDPEVGARANWQSGVYEADGSLKTGKEKWCATCHDEVPSLISGVSAPNVIGDEDGSYKYGTGWGYYTTGHGLAAGETYPSKGDIETVGGRPIECGSCHDLSAPHIDGDAKSFDCVDRYDCTPSVSYSAGYRLKMVGGLEPMAVPYDQFHDPVSAENFRLCTQCHDAGPFTDSGDLNTNFATWSGESFVNRHYSHLNIRLNIYPADYTFDYGDPSAPLLIKNSRATCVTCHNVHGSTNLAMVRDGKLINREPGLEIWYGNEDLAVFSHGSDTPDPENVPLSASSGTILRYASAANLCGGCHGSGMAAEYRCGGEEGEESDCNQPYQESAQHEPVLEWSGANGYEDDGVNPDNGPATSLFTFQVKYTDMNNDEPSTIQLWIDKDDDGIYLNDDSDPDFDEMIEMAEVDSRDNNYWEDGKIYEVRVPLAKAGDNTFIYQFHAVGNGDTVEFPSGSEMTVAVSNNRPVLSWTGEPYFETDGVSSNTGGLNREYEFRITYSDADGECPESGSSDIQLWLDENDDGYGAGEKQNLTEDSASDTDCVDGKIYTVTRTLATVGTHNYTFSATDGQATVTGVSGEVGNTTVTVQASANTPPLLEWQSGDCVTNGVEPGLGAAGENFEFAMKYSDPDGCPDNGVFQVWLDLDGDEGYSVSEQHAMVEADSSDTDCTDGKIYSSTLTITPSGSHPYRFYANDGLDDGQGEATTESTVEVIDAVAVYPGEGTPLQDAISPAVNQTILVYEGTYTENIQISNIKWEGKTKNDDVTLQSVCGPENTTIQASDATTYTAFIQGVSSPVIDGFTISGGSPGIRLNGGLTVKNSIVENNQRGIYSVTTSSVLQVEDSIIRNNTSSRGAGIFYNGGGPHSISGSVISNNQSTGGHGGGMYFQNSGNGLTIENSTIRENSTSGSGGGIFCTRSKLDLENVVISSNVAPANGGGLYMKENSTVSMVNSTVVDNTAGSYGGGIFLGNFNSLIGNLTMDYCTVSNNTLTNTVSGLGGGIYNRLSNVSITNSIFWGNQAAGLFSAHEAYAWLGEQNTFTFRHSDVMNSENNFSTKDGGTIDFDGTCINADPQFVDSASGDYHLKATSPAIDQGSTSADPPDQDMDGDLRPHGAGYDMGADEYVP